MTAGQATYHCGPVLSLNGRTHELSWDGTFWTTTYPASELKVRLIAFAKMGVGCLWRRLAGGNLVEVCANTAQILAGTVLSATFLCPAISDESWA